MVTRQRKLAEEDSMTMLTREARWRLTFDCGLAAVLLAIAAPAQAQWTQVAEIPTTQIFSVWANGDTLAAGADTAVYVSTNAGATWKRSARPVAGVGAIDALRVRNGRLFAGTFGQGVYFSDDLGTSWTAFNEGLVGGVLNSQLSVVDFQVLGDNLCAATAGAGMYVRGLTAGTWQTFGDVFEPNQASNVNTVTLGGIRLLAAAGANGMVFIRDPGDADWTISNLDNVGIHAGLSAQSSVFTGSGWLVGSNLGLFSSALGQEPWTRVDPGLGVLDWTTFATRAGHVFAAFDIPGFAVMEESDDNGASWKNEEDLTSAFVLKLAISGTNLYAARADGLWRRPIGAVSSVAVAPSASLQFALAGPQPFRDVAHLRFVLPQAGRATIRLFDVLGRSVGQRVDEFFSSGPHEVALEARGLEPGVYSARLEAAGARRALRLVHVQ
jgi:hypothetical protein